MKPGNRKFWMLVLGLVWVLLILAGVVGAALPLDALEPSFWCVFGLVTSAMGGNAAEHASRAFASRTGAQPEHRP